MLSSYKPSLEILEDRLLLACSPGFIEWEASQGGNGHCYGLTSGRLDWVQAEAEAVSRGGHLVAVNSAAEQAFLNANFLIGANANRPVWAGFTDQANEGTFVWTTGEPVTYTNWFPPREPNNFGGNEHYTAMNYFEAAFPNDPRNLVGIWNDAPLNGTFGEAGDTDGPYVGVIELEGGVTDIAATSLEWNATQGGVDFTYEVTGASLDQDVPAFLYWASGPKESDIIDVATASPITIPQSTPLDTPITEHIPDTDLFTPLPVGATHLVVVVDPSDIVAESDETNNSEALPLTDIRVLDATTTDFQRIEVKYAVALNTTPAFLFRTYLSTDAVFDPATSGGTDVPISGGQKGISGASARAVGVHDLIIDLPQRAPISDAHRFILIVADPDEAVQEVDNDANNAVFTIPLFADDEQMNKIGQKAISGFGETDDTASGPFNGVILRGTEDFTKLQSLGSIWQPPLVLNSDSKRNHNSMNGMKINSFKNHCSYQQRT